jgi:lipopolysaccharide biosynthesis glycosyltransferase
MSSPQQAVNIAFICDENYALCTGVAIYSLIKNKRPDSIYRIFILCIGVNAETAAQFHSLNSETVSISVINDSLPERYDAQVKSGWHVSPSALFKFNLPEIFPTLDKVLYLDGDILVQQDITQLYDQDISDYYAAVVKDKKALTFQGDFRKRLNIRHDAYFNSGVMLLNLSLMRRHDMTNQLIRYRETGINYFMDQDALNVIFRENVLYLSLLYNLIFSSVRDDSFSDTCAYYELADIKDKEDLFNRAYILHFSSPDKPWVYYDIPCADKWFSYYIASPFAAFQLERRSLAESIKQNPQSTNIQNRVVAPNSNHRFHMSTEPKLSVIIPVYNAGKYLEKCLNSIQKQTFLAFEVICIDDGSTDGSPAILKRFAKTDSRFQIISQRQQYAGVARNVGIQQARGEYIVFLDADDWFASTALEEFYARAVGTKADVIISTAYTVDARTGEKLLARWCLREQFLPKTKVFHAHDIPVYIYNISSGNPWAK